ncbi:hypothetical protein [Actinacidiphila epipremni]|jgi:uncharacterized protein YjdB|uniref:Clostridial hydrophobic W n=1 Tax=Actinacidiphila epipremni TaxID=2053013 RepID=A0ABX0ZKV7_9ACTN|nr:hypothetical protein [Actinacidiphila epipremni]NJP43376.1 hypothetical protein [Actinacidiphila epipremni]
MFKRLATVMAVAALTGGGVATGAVSADAAPVHNTATSAASSAAALSGGSICYQAHVQKYGWQSIVCDGDVAGTTGQSLRLEALEIGVSGTGTVCAQAHVQKLGWQDVECTSGGSDIVIGTTGQSLAIQAVYLWRADGISANAHLHGTGWQGWKTGSDITVGTTGESRPMEAIEITVP